LKTRKPRKSYTRKEGKRRQIRNEKGESGLSCATLARLPISEGKGEGKELSGPGELFPVDGRERMKRLEGGNG